MTGARTIRFSSTAVPSALDVMPHESLVELLTERFDLTGARESCAQGLCGCCTVIVDSKAVSACLYLAWFADGYRDRDHRRPGVKGPELSPVQQAFIDAGAFQCGFCTPGIYQYDGDPTARTSSLPERRSDSSLSRWKSLPLLRLSGNRAGREAGGRKKEQTAAAASRRRLP